MPGGWLRRVIKRAAGSAHAVTVSSRCAVDHSSGAHQKSPRTLRLTGATAAAGRWWGSLFAQGKDRRSLLDNSDGDDLLGAVAERLRFSDRIRRNRGLRLAYRIGVGVFGGLVLVAGVVMIPYPGPGWLVVFAGLAILATEFSWAERVLRYAKGRYDAWNDWLKRQRTLVRVAVWTATAVVVILTLWLLNAYGMIGRWFGLDWPWLSSPLM
jgi:uncharacterized protein (TIGR02611 family)